MGPSWGRQSREEPGERAWGAVVRGTAAVGPSTENKKRILVQTQEYLPHKPTFTFSISKSQSQGIAEGGQYLTIKAKFAYQVEVTGKKEFWLSVVRRDRQEGWEHDLHVRWEAGGSVPNIAAEEGTSSFDEEIAQMVAMGYDPETARRALLFKEGDLGAAASFIGACDLAEDMPADDARTSLPAATPYHYLPRKLNGVRVLIQEQDGRWRATTENFEVEPGSKGLGYRRSKLLEEKTDALLKWGACVQGTDEGDGWVRFSLEATEIAAMAGPVELIHRNEGGAAAESSGYESVLQPAVETLKTATPLSTMESMLEPAPLAGWSD